MLSKTSAKHPNTAPKPLAYLTDVLMRLPTHPNSRIEELLPTRWRPQAGPGQ